MNIKGYKKFVPLVLCGLMVFNVFTVISNTLKKSNEYNTYLKEARKEVKLDVIEDALKNYKKALDINDNVELNIEIGEMLLDHDWTTNSIEWGEHLVDKYPKDNRVYEFLLKSYMKVNDYEECFKLEKKAKSRGTDSKNFVKKMDSIRYVYTFGFDYFENVGPYSGGFYSVESEGKWGYANYKGTRKIKATFEWAGPFSSEGVAPVKDKNGKFYFVSDTGNKKIAVQNLKKCDGLGMDIGKIIPASDSGIYRYYDEDFNLLFGDKYDYGSSLNNGVAAVRKGKDWYVINKEGKKIGNKYKDIFIDEKGVACRNDRLFVKKGDSYKMIDSNGKEIGNQSYEDALLFLESDSLAAVKIDGKWGFVDKNGKIVIDAKYREAHSFSNGLAAVKKNGKWGYIDTSGKEVIKCEFLDVKDFTDKGTTFVKHEGVWKSLILTKNNYK